MKKVLLSLIFLPLFLFVATPAFADGSLTVTSAVISGNNWSVSANNFDPPFVSSPDPHVCLIFQGENVIAQGYCGNGIDSVTFTNSDNLEFPPQTPQFNTEYSYVIFTSHDDTSSHTGTFTFSEPVADLTVGIVASPASGIKTVGIPFNVDVKIQDSDEAFNAARATVSVSSNLEVTNVFPATSNSCSLHYTTTPTKDDPSFAGAIFGGSATNCTVYRMVVKPTATGMGKITFTNGSIKSYSDSSEILTGVQNTNFTINAGDTPTPTTGLSQLTITSPLQTYLTNFNLAGTRDAAITQVFVNDSDDDSTYPTSTTWSVPVTLNMGINNYTIYGRDAEANQTGTITTTVDRHTLGDVNGDGEIDLLDASLFAVDWDKTEDLSYLLSDMNADGNVDLTDLSILAKLE